MTFLQDRITSAYLESVGDQRRKALPVGSQYKDAVLLVYIPIVKKRRSDDRPNFLIELSIQGKTVFIFYQYNFSL